VEVSDTESEATYQDLFRSLKRRGLSGVELVVSDEHEGLKAAIARHFQGAARQRCQVHYTRNLLGMVAAKRRKDLAEDLRGVFAAPNREVTLGLASELADRWRGTHPGVAEHVEECIEECLTCLRLVSALAVEQSEEWLTGRRYLDMGALLAGRRNNEGREAKEVMLPER
jgi:putative transposase